MILRRILLLTKRLFKKPGFIVILALSFLLSGALCSFCDDGGSVLKVAVALSDPDDGFSKRVAKRLLEADSIIEFSLLSPEKAIEAVKSGEIDEAWIIPENIQAAIEKFFLERTAIVTVVRGRQDITSLISSERLSAAIYPEMSFEIYENFVLSYYPDNFDKDLLKKSYEEAFKLGKLIETETVESEPLEDAFDFLGASVRGIVSLLVLFAGLSAQMYFLDDREKGCFDSMGSGKRFSFNLITVQSACLSCAAVCFASLALFGYFQKELLWEGLSYLIYSACSCGFCMVLGALVRKTSVLGVLIPFVVLLGLFATPVFFDFKFLRPVSVLLPCHWYLQTAANASMALYAVCYSALTIAAAYLFSVFTSKYIRE